MNNKTLLKKSQFNYFVKEKNGDIILFNFAKGLPSLCKIPETDCTAFYELVNKVDRKEMCFDSNKEYIVKLVQHGMLVPEDYDEFLTVDRLYYESAMDQKVRIIVMPTEECNFRCKYCYESYQKGAMSNQAQIALLKFIQNKISTTRKLQISWFGGEPLEAVDIVYHIMTNVNKMVEQTKTQLVSDMTTNGYNLDANTFDKLYRLNVRTYQVTLDGLEQQHNKQRVLKNGEGTFHRILDNLLYIKKNYTKYPFASIVVRVNVGQEILEHLSDFIVFYRQAFGNDRRFVLSLTPINDMGGAVVQQMKHQLIDAKQIYQVLDMMDVYKDTSIQLSDVIRALTPADALCYASKKNTHVIGSDLSVYKCTVHFDMEDNVLGKILSNGHLEIDELKDQKWYTYRLNKDICRSCFMLPCCFGSGCPHKRVFCAECANQCMLASWKAILKNAIQYVSSSKIEVIKISSL